MRSCRTSAADTTKSPPTSHRPSAWRQHSTSSRWSCDLRFSRPDACLRPLDATGPRAEPPAHGPPEQVGQRTRPRRPPTGRPSARRRTDEVIRTRRPAWDRPLNRPPDHPTGQGRGQRQGSYQISRAGGRRRCWWAGPGCAAPVKQGRGRRRRPARRGTSRSQCSPDAGFRSLPSHPRRDRSATGATGAAGSSIEACRSARPWP